MFSSFQKFLDGPIDHILEYQSPVRAKSPFNPINLQIVSTKDNSDGISISSQFYHSDRLVELQQNNLHYGKSTRNTSQSEIQSQKSSEKRQPNLDKKKFKTRELETIESAELCVQTLNKQQVKSFQTQDQQSPLRDEYLVPNISSRVSRNTNQTNFKQEYTDQIKPESERSRSRSKAKGYESSDQFFQQQAEWLKKKEAKIIAAREAQDTAQQIEFQKPSIPIKNLPKDYKGPLKGYYEQVSHYWEQKTIQNQLKEVRDTPIGKPKINRLTNIANESYQDQIVEDRLLKKGQEYQNKRTKMIKDIHNQETHQFKPQLVSKQITPSNLNSSEERRNLSLHTTHESLYASGINSLIKKQTKIVNKMQADETQYRVPQICQKSRELAANRTFSDLFKPPKKYVAETKPTVVNQMTTEQLKDFLRRNYELGLAQKTIKSEYAENIKLQQEIEAKNATPTLSKGTLSMITEKRSATFEELYKAATVIREKRIKLSEEYQRERVKKEMSQVTFKPKLNKNNDAKAQVPSHTAAIVPSGSLGALSFGVKQLSYHQRFKQKLVYQSLQTDSAGFSPDFIKQKNEINKDITDFGSCNASIILGRNDHSPDFKFNSPNNFSNTQPKQQIKNGDEDLIKSFLLDVLPGQSQRIIEEAQKAILDFDLSAKLIQPKEDEFECEKKNKGLVTPPVKSQKFSSPPTELIQNQSYGGSSSRRSEFKQTGQTSQNFQAAAGETQAIQNYYLKSKDDEMHSQMSQNSSGSGNYSPFQKNKRRQDNSEILKQSQVEMSPLQHLTDPAFQLVRDLNFENDQAYPQSKFGALIEENSFQMLDEALDSNLQNSENYINDLHLSDQPTSATDMLPMILDSRVNHTLSQINEEYEEDDISGFTSKPYTPNTQKRRISYDSKSGHSNRSGQRSMNLSFTGKSDIHLAPKLILQIEEIENDFNDFLEKLYN